MATITITAPTNNATVPKNTDLTVSFTTDRPDLDYVIELISDMGGVGKDIRVPGTGNSPMSGVIPGRNLAANSAYQIRVKVAPGQGTGSSTVNITVGP